jgi:thiamine biosynthesis protein ThiS
MPKIEVQLNGEAKEVDGGLSLTGLLAALGVPEAIAIVERNGEVVPRARFAEVAVAAGDRLEIVRLMGGG